MKRLTDEEKRLAESCFNLACGVARKQCKRDGTDRYLDDYMEAAWWCLVALAGNGRWNPLIGKFSTYCHKPLIRAVYKESQRLRQRQAVGEADEAARLAGVKVPRIESALLDSALGADRKSVV